MRDFCSTSQVQADPGTCICAPPCQNRAAWHKSRAGHSGDTLIPYDIAQTGAARARPQRARGRAMVSAQLREARSVIRDLAMSGSAKLLFPRGQGPLLDAVFLNSAGGITGGDAFALEGRAHIGAGLRLTTQAAERIYRSVGDSPPGEVHTTLEAAPGSTLHWLPQETILYDGAALSRRLRIDMAGDARVLACETLIFGRKAMGESVDALRLADRIDLYRDDALVFADRLRLDGDALAALNRSAVAGGGLAVASVLVAGPQAAALLKPLRALLGTGAGASALDDDLIFLRLVAEDGFAMRRTLVPVLQTVTGGDLPRPWML